MAQSGASLVAKMQSPLALACEPPVRGVNKNDQLVHTAEEQRNAGNGDVKFDSTKLWRTTGDETIQEEKRKPGSGNMKIWSRKLGQHDESGHKSLLKSDALYQYILETSVYPREHEALRRLRQVTAKHSWNFMATSPDEGQFLAFLVKMMNARNTLELGVYTGYSLLSTALALPTDGKIVAVDINRHYYNIGVPYIEEAGVAQKIDFREGPALDTLKTLVKEEKHHGFFDFIFVDADKDNYINYHPYLLKLVRKGGVIGYDNTLWNGAVIAGDEEPMPGYVRHYKGFVCDLNKALAKDPQIEISHIAISDGITLCRKIA